MIEKTTNLRYSAIFVKTEHLNDYVPKNPSPEALICLTCTADKCKGICDRYKEEHRKLKEKL